MQLCGFEVGLEQPLFLIAGPCVVETEQLALDSAGALQEITGKLAVPFIYKSSFDKANRSSGDSYRGARPGTGTGYPAESEGRDRRTGIDRRARGYPA